jgi:acyl-CoA thioester hydrolase
MAEFNSEFRVEFGETDMAGIVFYPNYFRWFDRATHDFLRSIGLAFEEMVKLGLATPLIEVGCRFMAALHYNETLRLESRVVEVRERGFRLEHNLYRGEELVGKGFEVRGWCEINGSEGKLKAVPIPQEVAEKLKG